MGVIGHIQKGFQTAFQSPALIVLVCLYNFVWSLVNIPLVQTQENNPTLVMSIVSVVLTVIFLLTMVYMLAGLATYVRERVRSGRASLQDFKNGGGRYYLPTFCYWAIMTLFIAILLIISVLSIFATGDGEGEVSTLSVIVSFVVAGVGLTGLFFMLFAPHAIVVDELKVIPAMKMSISLVKKNVLSLMAIGVILICVYIGVWAVITAIVQATGLIALQPTVTGQIIFGALGSIVNGAWQVVTTGIFMSFYLSLRSPQTVS